MGGTTGTQLPDGTVVIKGDPQQMHHIRCMACHGQANEVRRPDGKKIYKCVHCGREWTSTKI
jgi:DNA-directed RNA polymerase subunit RPC12/RpoP